MDTTPNTLREDFLTQGLYLRGWSEQTVRTYRQGLATLPDHLSKATLAAWVIAMRQCGLTPGGINMYARTINSYLSWLHAERHIPERLRIKLLPNPPKPLRHCPTRRSGGWYCSALTVGLPCERGRLP